MADRKSPEPYLLCRRSTASDTAISNVSHAVQVAKCCGFFEFLALDFIGFLADFMARWPRHICAAVPRVSMGAFCTGPCMGMVDGLLLLRQECSGGRAPHCRVADVSDEVSAAVEGMGNNESVAGRERGGRTLVTRGRHVGRHLHLRLQGEPVGM